MSVHWSAIGVKADVISSTRVLPLVRNGRFQFEVLPSGKMRELCVQHLSFNALPNASVLADDGKATKENPANAGGAKKGRNEERLNGPS